MERAGSFSAVPGVGMALVGASALGAAALSAVARARFGERGWFAVWLAELVIAAVIARVAIEAKARAIGQDLGAAPARRFVRSFALPFVVGGFVTFALLGAGLGGLVPAMWLLFYGLALVAGWGSVAREIVPLLGLAFVLIGTVALFAPPAWGVLFLAAGFGGLHVVFGLVIARRFGG